MASAFAHALVAGTIRSLFPKYAKGFAILLACIFCAVIPDADVLMFKLGFHYEHWLGHRGFFHSIFFSMLLGTSVAYLGFYKSKNRLGLALLFSLCAISHGCFDAITNGGMGVAFFSPFDNSRYFFPWRPILVSPMSAARFFSEWGLKVLQSEALYIGLPCIVILVIKRFVVTNVLAKSE